MASITGYTQTKADELLGAKADTADLGGAALLDVGTTTGTVKAGDYQPTAADVTDSTAAGRALLIGASAAAQRASLDVLRRRGTRAFIFGDSHAQGTAAQGGGSDWRINRNQPVGSSFLAHAIWLSQSRVQFWGNGGIGGERTDQIYARVAEATTSGAHLVLLNMGTNDARLGYTLAHTQQYYKATVEAIVAAGLDIIITGVPPIDDPSSVKDAMDKINQWLQWYAAEMRIPFVDVCAALAEPTTRSFAAIYRADGVHLNAPASVVAGQAVADVIAQHYAPIAGWGCMSNVDATNIFGNAWGLTDATADGIPDGWYTLGTPTGGTATHTREDVTGWLGKAICIEQAANTNARQIYRDVSINTGAFAVGDLIRASISAKSTGTGELMARVLFVGSSTGRAEVRLFSIKAPIGQITSVVEFRVPAGTTNLQFYMYAGPGTGKYFFNRPTVTNLTRLGIASGLE